MKYFLLLICAASVIYGCKDAYDQKHIQHKWQHTVDDLKYTDGTPISSITYADSTIEFWTFSSNSIEKIYTTGSTTYSYTIKNQELKEEGQGNIAGFNNTYTIKSISDNQMILLYDLTNEAGQKNGEANMNFKKVD